jgi:WD40 repeat protein
LRLWNAATGAPVGPAMKHDGSVRGALLTKDEKRILSWSADGTLRLWDPATSAPIGPPMKHGGSVRGALLTEDETRILSWSDDGTLRLWDATWPKGNLLQVACALLKDHVAVDASKQYGVSIKPRICSPETAMVVPNWSLIERDNP